jgi:radical SAM protein with 4Fe4S-binding SPASM domain
VTAMSPARHYAMWMFTGACPSRCTYCDIASQQGRQGLSTAQVERVAQEILDAGFTEVMFVGGEALLSPDLPAALRVLEGKVRTAVFTGGLPGLAERAVSVLAEGKVDRIVYSIDSGAHDHNDLLRGRAGITRDLLELCALVRDRLPHIDRSVNTVVSRFNVRSLGEVWERMFGLDSWALTLAGDSFQGNPRHAFLDLPMLESLYFETVPALAARAAEARAELVVLPVPLPLLAARIPPVRWGEIARGQARIELLAELERYSRGDHNASFVHRHGCPLPGIDVVIGVGGEVHPCSQAPIIHPDYVVGNVKEQPLAEILAGDALRDFAAKVPHKPCTRCWAPSNIPRETLVRLLARPRA